MRLNCPACHTSFDLVSALEEGDGRDFVRWLASQEAGLVKPLVAYLSLFRSRTRALSWERALRLAQEVVAMGADPRAISHAVESLRKKQNDNGILNWKPLQNHNYLKSVMATLEPLPPSAAPAFSAHVTTPSSRTAEALASIDAYCTTLASVEYVAEVRTLLKRLIILQLEGHPPAGTIVMVMEEWLRFLLKRLDFLDFAAQQAAIAAIGGQLAQFRRWPTLNELSSLLPRRPLSAPVLPEPTTEEVLAEHARLRSAPDEVAAPRHTPPTTWTDVLAIIKQQTASPAPPAETRRDDINRQLRQIAEQLITLNRDGATDRAEIVRLQQLEQQLTQEALYVHP